MRGGTNFLLDGALGQVVRGEGIIRIADAGLLMAKELGRNRVVYADEDLAAEVFGGKS